MIRKISISLRLTLWFSTVVLFGLIVFGIAMWLDLAWSLSQGRDRTLQRRASRLIDLLNASRGDSPTRRQARFDEFADATPEGNLIQVFGSDGRRLYPRTVSPPDFPWPSAGRIQRSRLSELTFRRHRYRLLEMPVAIDGQQLDIFVAGNLEDNRQLLAHFSQRLAIAIPAFLALAAWGGYFLSRRVLKPVDEFTVAVRSISIGNLSGRLPIHQTGDEFERLAETCNDMLARLESAVGRIHRFTADASHELRSPISFIRTVAEYALRNPAIDHASREAFEEILAESAEAARLLEDMLMLARADAGYAEVVFEPLNLVELVEEMCAKIKPLAEAKHQSLTLRNGDHDLPFISGDSSSLRRLLWTLLDNAVKYTPERGRIEVALQREAEQARVTVKDSGIGIPEAMLPRVFERFFRADPSRSQVEGTGLGLAIAKWIADVHHAALSVESKEAEGSTFTIVLPLNC